MNNKKLTVLAAKAAGIIGTWHHGGFVAYSGWSRGTFDPPTDDGDALRLAVKLSIDFSLCGCGDGQFAVANAVARWTNGDALRATRYVITSAAAQIGEGME